MKLPGPSLPAVAALAAFLTLVLSAHARAEALRAEFSPLTLRPRTHAPAIFDIKLHRQGAGLLEGTLEITLVAGGDVVLRQSTQHLTLAAGTQSFRVLTPPLPPHESYSGTEARLRFVAKNTTLDLGRFPAAAASRGVRNFVIAICDGRTSGVRDTALWQSLRLETLFPASASTGKNLATSPAFLAPEDFPVHPLALLAFDMVLLDGDGLALLREKQLAALTRWVEAGGSLCLLPGRGLRDEHARFLAGFARPNQPAPWRLADTGEWQPAEGRPHSRRAGLGRVVIATRPAGDLLASGEWRAVAAFLWKFRGGTLYLAGGGPRSEAGGQYLDGLLPKSTRLLTPGTLALILGGFLLVVGPLDWFALGAIRRRRWTWIVFPLAAAGCTALVIEAAGRALGREDQRRALVVTDVGPGGRVLRESRIELHLTARDREAHTELRQAFAVPAALRAGRSSMQEPGENVGPAKYSGQVPARYALRQHLRQWTPRFTRMTSLEPSAAPDAEIPWAEIDAALAAGGDPLAKLRPLVADKPALRLHLLHGTAFPAGTGYPVVGPSGLVELCLPPKSGIASFFSGTAPSGAANAGDLPLLDPRNPAERLLVISRETPGGGVQLYRRLFHTDDP